MKNLFTIYFITSILPLLSNNLASAQIIPDQSLGNESSIVNSTNNLQKIEGGAIRDNNLFHSFQEFNVNTNQETFFNNPINIQNIFTRVTGGNISNIDGLISNVGQADLFILNPAGIIFGENAQLNIGGSFFATTAESILFPKDIEFSAINPGIPPLLTVNIPIGLQFGNNPKDIINRANFIKEERFGKEEIPVIFPNFNNFAPIKNGMRTINIEEINTLVGLEVKPTKNIILVGGDIILDSGALTALSGRVQLGGLRESGVIIINADGNLGFPKNLILSDVKLINDASIDVRGNGGGDIMINGQNVEIKDGSSLLAGIRAFQGSSDTLAGDIIINGIDTITIDGVRKDNTIRGGEGLFSVVSNDVGILLEEKELNTESELVFLGEFEFPVNGEGRSGNIEINTKKLNITNGARINNVNFGRGFTGNIEINAESEVNLENTGSAIFNTIFTGEANTRNIEIKTQDLKLTDGAVISQNNFRGKGNLGNIIINAQESVVLDGKTSDNPALPTERTEIFNVVNSDGIGNGGFLEINTKNLSLTDGGSLYTSTTGTGNAGDVNINSIENISINKGRISSGVQNFDFLESMQQIIPQGNGGTIIINSKNLTIAEEGSLSVSSEGIGNVGQIIINGNYLELDGGEIIAETNFKDPNNSLLNKNQDNLVINIQDNLILKNNSLISAKATQKAKGGNIAINADFIITFPQNNDIIASADRGDGGRINITTNAIFGIELRDHLTSLSDITASSDFGLDGDVSINILEIDPGQSLTQLTTQVIDASKLITQGCLVNNQEETNEFVLTGRGGLPNNPNESLRGNAVLSAEWINLPQKREEAKIVNPRSVISENISKEKEIVEAKGWIVGDNGNVILTALANNKVTGDIDWQIPHICSN